MLQSATFVGMRTISQRELRNDNAEIMRGIEEGETYVVTRRGVPIARIVPYVEESGLRIDRPARVRGRFSDIERVTVSESIEDMLDELRGDR